MTRSDRKLSVRIENKKKWRGLASLNQKGALCNEQCAHQVFPLEISLTEEGWFCSALTMWITVSQQVLMMLNFLSVVLGLDSVR